MILNSIERIAKETLESLDSSMAVDLIQLASQELTQSKVSHEGQGLNLSQAREPMRVRACVTLLPLLPKSLFSQHMHKKQNKKVNAGVGVGGGVLSCGPETWS